MSCSKPLPPFVCDLLYYLNREQLERFTIVCRPLKNFIERYFHAKPYRVFEGLKIRRGSYALIHSNKVQWHPNQNDYSAQQFLACSSQIYSPAQLVELQGDRDKKYYSFAEMRPYLSPTVRIKNTTIFVAGDSTYNLEHIAEMESIAYLWRDGDIHIYPRTKNNARIGDEDFQLILNSPTILQCQSLLIDNAYFSFKDYKVLCTVNVIIIYLDNEEGIDLDYLLDFLEQPGVKPVVALFFFHHKVIENLLNRLSKAFSSAVVSNAFKIGFVQEEESLTEFRETNKTSGEKLELKKGLSFGFKNEENFFNYTLERSII